MQIQCFLLLLAIGLGLAGCTPRLHGSYAVQPTLLDPDHIILTFTGSRFRSCYDGVDNGAIGSGTFTLRKRILTLYYGPTPTYVPSTDSLAIHLSESYTRRDSAGTVARYQYARVKVRQAFQLATILPPADTAYINYKLSLGVPAEELKVREPEFRFWHRISAEEAAKCLRE